MKGEDLEIYLQLLDHILTRGKSKEDRTGVGTLSVFGHQMRFDLAEGFPLVTTKRVHFKSVVGELLWFLRGDTNVQFLWENGITIWDEWADADGNLGPIYGHQWRRFGERITPSGDTLPGLDQIADVIERIRREPTSRRLVVSSWNPLDVATLGKAPPPCHSFFQFYVVDGQLSCQLYQRSCDAFLGVPFNIASYAALTLMVCQQTGLAPGEFIHTLGDAHIYRNHLDQVRTQLARVPRPLPALSLREGVQDIFSYHFDDFLLEGYDPHPSIPAPVAV